MRSGAACGVAIALAVLFAIHLPVVAADCVEVLCYSDEDAGDTSKPCEDGIGKQHDSRYRYLNASVAVGDIKGIASLTFACESTGFRGEYFWGNVTVTDGERTDQLRAYYYYGRVFFGPTCAAWVDVDPDLVKLQVGPGFDGNMRIGIGYSSLCPEPQHYPSVVSTLP